MTMDTALNRTLRALAHPWTLVWVLALLVNDHILRIAHPGWITGKLGDVAWLAFAPLIVAVPIAMVIPRRRVDRDRTVALVAWGFTAGLFAVVKAIPAASAAFSALFRSVFGWTPLLVCDPTDLLALPALMLAWRRWWAQDAGPLHLPRRAWWVLGLAALVTLGNSGPPNEGITCLTLGTDGLYASPGHGFAMTGTFLSADGGLTWTELAEDPQREDASCAIRTTTWTYAVPNTPITYRFTPGQRIERSDDGGQTWALEYRLTGDDARMAYYISTRYNVQGDLGPTDALFDPASGNLVLAMGQEGVLVRDIAGKWAWRPVGEYRFESISSVGQLATLLFGELQLAAAVAFLAVGIHTWRLFRRIGQAATLIVGFAVGFVAVVAHPALTSGYEGIITTALTIGVLIAAVITAIAAVVRLVRTPKPMTPGAESERAATPIANRLLATTGLAIFAAVAFLTPYVLWGVGVLARYTPATSLAITVTGLVMVGIGASGPRLAPAVPANTDGGTLPPEPLTAAGPATSEGSAAPGETELPSKADEL